MKSSNLRSIVPDWWDNVKTKLLTLDMIPVPISTVISMRERLRMLNDHDAKRINKELIEAQSSIKFTLVGYVVVNSDGQWLVDAENATFNTDMMDSILFVRAIDAEKIAKLYPGAKVEHFLHIVTTV